MSRISGIIAFQTKKSNLERDLRKETDIKWITKGNRKIPHTFFRSFICQSDAMKRKLIFNNAKVKGRSFSDKLDTSEFESKKLKRLLKFDEIKSFVR